MKNWCRFCRKGKVKILFGANKGKNFKRVENYACTNCGFGLHGTIVECENCKIVYVKDNISQDKINAFYEQVNDPLYLEEQEARKRTFSRYLARLEQIAPKKGYLLDIGTNTGLFVKLANDNGWNGVGLEPSRQAVAFAKQQYGLELINKSFEKCSFPKESFDAITMWDVIEHFVDPVMMMKKVYDQLKVGGVFAFTTTNPKSLLAIVMGTKWPWYMDMHRVFFSKRAAKYYLEKIGFKKVIFMSHWRYLSLRYLSTRLMAISRNLPMIIGGLVNAIGIDRIIVPYYANDLYDCYAFK